MYQTHRANVPILPPAIVQPVHPSQGLFYFLFLPKI
jgi:hypothetical protein